MNMHGATVKISPFMLYQWVALTHSYLTPYLLNNTLFCHENISAIS